MGVLSVYFIIPSDMGASYYNAYLKSITFYAVPLVNKSQTTINGKQMLVFKSDDILIEKLEPASFDKESGKSVDALQIEWDNTVILDNSSPDKDYSIKFEIQKYYTYNVFTKLTKIELPQGLKTIGTIETAAADVFDSSKRLTLSLNDLITEMIIPETVETIGDWVFSSNNFQSIIIPPSVKKIGHFAFYNSKNIKELIIPNSVTDIGSYCFNTCASLEKIKIGNGIARLEQSPYLKSTSALFGNCQLLKEIIFGKNISYIDSDTFINCPLIEFIAFPSENVEIKGLQFITAYKNNPNKSIVDIKSFIENTNYETSNNIGTNFSNPTGPPYKATILTVDNDINPDTKITFSNSKAYYNYILLNKYPDDITITKITRDFLQKKAQCYIESETSCGSKKLANKCYRGKIRHCLIEYKDEGFQTEFDYATVYNNIYIVLGLMVAMLVGLQIMHKYKLVSDVVSNSASMILLSAGLIYSVILYQHLESTGSKKVLSSSEDVDIPKTEQPLTEVESKPITQFEAYKTIDYHSYTK